MYNLILFVATGELVPFHMVAFAPLCHVAAFLTSWLHLLFICYGTANSTVKMPSWKTSLRVFITTFVPTLFYPLMLAYIFTFSSVNFWAQNIMVVLWVGLVFVLKQAVLLAGLKRKDTTSAILAPGFYIEVCVRLVFTLKLSTSVSVKS